MKNSMIAAALLATSAMGAQKPDAHHRISPDHAAKVALHRFPGKLVKTPKLEHEDGKWQYEVLVKSHGKLKEIDVDARTGKIGDVETTSATEEAREESSKKGD
jgi:uncharacterized membrane protein YkoI